MQSQVRIKPLIAVLCDDIREEKSGKPIIIGVYMGNITIVEPVKTVEMPNAISLLRLALWIPFEASQAGNALVEIKLIGPAADNETIIKAGIEVKKTPATHETGSLNLVGLTILANQEGELKVLFRHEGDDVWQTLTTIPIRIMESSNSSTAS